MDFALSEEQLMLEDSVEKFIANDYDFDTRQKYAGSDTGYSRDVWQQFAELGWLEHRLYIGRQLSLCSHRPR